MPKKSHYGPKDEVLFPEDVEWIDQLETNISLNRQKSLPFYDESDVSTANISRPLKRGDSRQRPAEKIRRLSSNRRLATLAVRGLPQCPLISADNGKRSNPTLTKQIRCDYCAGFIDFVSRDHVLTHQKKYYHRLCFQYVLNPEDQRRRLPPLPV